MAAAESPSTLTVEVVYAPGPHCVDGVTLQVPPGTTALQALRRSGLLERHGLAPEQVDLGVWTKPVTPGHVLRERDRVEIYRPLQVDPKEARRQRYKGKRAR